ncbi:MAG: bifunctional metallophosphatase/5'-nucleotidase [Ruminococcaceae bacterium]|nr:bifunctional metallophosphatase/5'-nucleotidase [Oscillospiraceae bacterium]
MKKFLSYILVVTLLLATLLTACTPVVPDDGTQPTDPSETQKPTTGTEATEPGHVHIWSDATCTQPPTCACGEMQGEALGHTWVAATCTAAKYCSVCAVTVGSPMGHTYVAGICTDCAAAEPTDPVDPSEHVHTDDDLNETCDTCGVSVVVLIDFYAINDLHGKFCDTAAQPGVDELATYLKSRENYDDNVILLSSGDMWQGASESNLTGGLILTEWMNAMGFVSMTLGNHEFDWGEEKIRKNFEIAEFPFLAINIYNRSTGELADYCTPSVVVERDGIQIGIIGAIGDVYSSISADRVTDVEFKVGSQLTALIKAESERLRSQGVDIIVLSAHDGIDGYDAALSNGYVDVCFEGHTHRKYVQTDAYGVYHVQGGGENDGISHVELSYNLVSSDIKVTEAEFLGTATYTHMEDDPDTEALEDKYSNVIDYAYAPLGTVSQKQWSSRVEDIVSELYLKVGMERWGEEYDIVLGGGFLKTRSPYDLAAGQVTYSQVLSLFPFDNQIVLCRISGRNLKNRFVNTNNSDYHNTYSEYGNSIKNRIDTSKTYYIVVDMYTAVYAPNGLTIVEYYDDNVFARDLLAQEIMAGRFDTSK